MARKTQTKAPGGRTSGQYTFAHVPSVKRPRSTFDRSHGVKTTFDSGYLIPIFVDEVLPGDTFKMNVSTFVRMATPLQALMDNLKLTIHWWFCPYRILWSNWKAFMGEQRTPTATTDYTIPQIEHTQALGLPASGDIYDYFGIPIGVESTHSALPFRAFNKIWNEFYRDQNLQGSLTEPTGDGPDDPAFYALRRRGKRHDYFTSSLPWAQKGPESQVPIGAVAPVVSNEEIPLFKQHLQSAAGTQLINVEDQGENYRSLGLAEPVTATDGSPMAFGLETGLEADLSSATSITVNDLRMSIAIQRMYERDARSGTRYSEMVLGHFGVDMPDAQWRPEFLGGSTQRINVTPVPQTSSTISSGDDASPQGNIAAFATSADSGRGFVKSFVEHGVVIGLAQVSADLNYQQGLERFWSRLSRFDFYFPEFANLGEQAVKSKEIYLDGTEDDETAWGYQERWAEYRYKPSRISGLFRSQASGSLDSFHLAQDFSSRPLLNASFIQDTPPVSRVIAVPSEPEFIMDCFFNFKCTRPMPLYSVPGLRRI